MGYSRELQVLLDFVQPGDTLVVTRIDRLARSMKDLQDIVHELEERGVALRATEQTVDTGTAAGKAFLDMLGVFAEFETNLRRERQLERIKAASATPALRFRYSANLGVFSHHHGMGSFSQRVNVAVGPSEPSSATRTTSRAPFSRVLVPA